MADSRQPSGSSTPYPIDTQNVTYAGYYRNHPHWRLESATYLVTWRVHSDQPELIANERSETVLALRHFDGQRFHLIAWVVMDDHMHVLVQPCEGFALEKIVHSWKSYSANQLQRRFGRKGAIWHREYFDRVVRNEKEFEQKLHYVLNNPLKRWPEIGEYEWVGVHPTLGPLRHGGRSY